ncbi:hypothetical protein [Brevundimonas sp.]|uniref:hypothetical protein n=1 Tax=Brevundimonas sp. TaxID=1871086 RepID=UPI002FCB15A0
MSAFEFSFTFYGLVLGLSVVELVAGIARTVHGGGRFRVGWLTPLVAIYLALDVATFWSQSWVMNQHAPYSFTLLLLGLVSAGLFYIAASLVFPRDPEDGYDLTEHFWKHRRMIFSMVLAANILNQTAVYWLFLASGYRPGIGDGAMLAVFAALLAAILLPRGKWAVVMFVLVLTYNVAFLGADVFALVQNGPWQLGNAIPGADPTS